MLILLEKKQTFTSFILDLNEFVYSIFGVLCINVQYLRHSQTLAEMGVNFRIPNKSFYKLHNIYNSSGVSELSDFAAGLHPACLIVFVS